MRDFESINAVPEGISLSHLNEGTDGVAKTLLNHKAIYHKGCRTKCNSSTFKRVSTSKRHRASPAATPSPKKTRSSFNASYDREIPECVVCGLGDEVETLHKARSDDVDIKFDEWCKKANDWTTYARLQNAADAHAGDVYYHTSCYMKLKTKARSADRAKTTSSNVGTCYHDTFDELVMAQLAVYIVDSKLVLPVSELVGIYLAKLNEMGKPCGFYIHHSRFAEHLVRMAPDHLTVDGEGPGRGHMTFIAHKTVVGTALKCEFEKRAAASEDEARDLVKTALYLRQCITSSIQPQFNGRFQPANLPQPLLMLLNIVLQGPGCFKSDGDVDGLHLNEQRSRAANTLAQLIVYNTAKRPTKGKIVMRHSRTRETPFPLYMGLKLHTDAKLKHLISTFEQLGLCVSYQRERDINKAFAIGVSDRIKKEGVVVPSNVRKGVFTTTDFDNIDQHKRSNLSREEFHGGLLSVTNHLSDDNHGTPSEPITIDNINLSTRPVLPASYSVVPPAELDTNIDTILPSTTRPVRPEHDRISGATVKDQAWIEAASNLIEGDMKAGDVVTWAGFNSSLLSNESVKPRAIIGVLPLFPDKAASVPMVKHSMMLSKAVTAHLNPGQTPVQGMDQPIFAIGKQVQWKWKDTLGEDKFVLMLGALHIEFVLEAVEGKLVDGSGFSYIIGEAGVLTTGRAEAVSTPSADHHMKRTRYVHQVFLLAGSVLKNEAYNAYQEAEGPCEKTNWDVAMRNSSQLFSYWSLILDLEMLHCRFVRSLREGDFDLYVQVIDELCGWVFRFDQTNYSRWLPIHVKDMIELEWKHPEILKEFRKGNFAVQKSQKKFSLIPKDHSHEQTTKTFKSASGVSNLYDTPDTMDEHIMAFPEKLQAITEFEEAAGITGADNIHIEHHEEGHSIQVRFTKDVQSVIEVLRRQGSPFLPENGPELYAIDTREVMPTELADILCNAYETGKQLHETYVNQRLASGTAAISDTIKKSSISTFAKRPDSRAKYSKISSLKRDTSLVSRLFLSIQSRPDFDLNDFFRFENQREPPSLSNQGQLRSGKKSDVLTCLSISKVLSPQDISVKVLDGAAVVHMVRPTKATDFDQYVSRHFMPFITSTARASTTPPTRLDIVFDTYPENSLKAQTQSKRSTPGATTIVEGSTPVPQDWNKFLANRNNKIQLFQFLSKSVIEASHTLLPNVVVYSTNGDLVIASRDAVDLSGISPSNHQEADSRIFLHLSDAAQQGHSKAMIRTVDSDIVVIAVAQFRQLSFTELWVAFGTGKNFMNIPVHDIAQHLGPQKSISLPLFHALSGCDTTSALLGIGKKTAWAAWEAYPDLSETLVALTEEPHMLTIDSVHMQRLERWTVIMYAKGGGCARVNEARRKLFSQGTRTLEHIPPTQAALLEHSKRALHQAGFVWEQSQKRQQSIPDASHWGWAQDPETGVWSPFWTLLADASHACALLLHCGCEKACKGNCKCAKAGLRCSVMCHCEGGCVNND
ncbi:MAG: hypothetical protein ABW185_01030 [Sedimenticola sp.]